VKQHFYLFPGYFNEIYQSDDATKAQLFAGDFGASVFLAVTSKP
jgi:hypothetical protein